MFKYSERGKVLAESFINGNREHVWAALDEMRGGHGAALTMEILANLDVYQQESFVRMLRANAE